MGVLEGATTTIARTTTRAGASRPRRPRADAGDRCGHGSRHVQLPSSDRRRLVDAVAPAEDVLDRQDDEIRTRTRTAPRGARRTTRATSGSERRAARVLAAAARDRAGWPAPPRAPRAAPAPTRSTSARCRACRRSPPTPPDSRAGSRTAARPRATAAPSGTPCSRARRAAPATRARSRARRRGPRR